MKRFVALGLLKDIGNMFAEMIFHFDKAVQKMTLFDPI